MKVRKEIIEKDDLKTNNEILFKITVRLKVELFFFLFAERKPKLATRPQAQNGSKNNSSSNSGGGSSGGKSLLSSSCPPHVQMSSEAVAAALPPLLDNSNTDSSLEASDLKIRSGK